MLHNIWEATMLHQKMSMAVFHQNVKNGLNFWRNMGIFWAKLLVADQWAQKSSHCRVGEKFKKRNSSIYRRFLELRVGENSRQFSSIFITPSIFGQPYS